MRGFTRYSTLTPLLVLLGYGTSDQDRANHGIAIAGDATISVVAQAEDRTPSAVDREFTKEVNPWIPSLNTRWVRVWRSSLRRIAT